MMSLAQIIVLLAVFCSLLMHPATSIPLENFYPFGNEFGDSELPSNDDGSTGPITLSSPFPFFASFHTTLFVNNNGDISFDTAVSTFTPQPFPLSGDLQLIAPYWADIDTTNGGRVWYREASSDTSLLMKARNDIRLSFSVRTFQPTFLFIATWDQVAFYGPGASSPLRNTFQCILVSDGQRSFVLFLYADGLIQWTTGDASGGTDGLGGTPAQVGFNAGDGIRFASVPGSRTANIVNIDTTSNIGRNGVWLFTVDQEEIVIGFCGDSESLQIAPRVGNMLGGTTVLLAGPCFNSTDAITCMFDGSIGVSGMYISEAMAVCVSPYFETKGWKELTVTISTALDVLRYSRENRFYAVSFEDSADIGFNQLLGPSINPSPSLHFGPNSRVSITWDPDSLVSRTDPTSFVVDIALSQMNMETGRWERLQTLATDEDNDGEADVIFPSASTESASDNTLPVAIEVVVASQPSFDEAPLDREVSETLMAIVGVAKRWSAIIFFTSSYVLREACENWISKQGRIGEEILSRVPPCPRTVNQARADSNTFKEDSSFSRLLTTNFFHRGAATCFRQISFTPSNMRSGQQCCYYPNGFLATDPPAGGTVDRVSPEISLKDHFIADVLPSIACCFGLFSNCEAYYEHRPSDDGSRYDPPNPACVYGDPHIVTLDGFKYTFNGQGEYILIETPGNQFILQGRMEVPTGNSLPPGIQATVFTAIVAKEVSSDTVQIQFTSSGQSLEILMNGVPVDFSDLTDQEFNNVSVSNLGNDTLAATFSSGVYIKAKGTNGIISTLFLSLSQRYQGQMTGLMGNFNEDMTDDLLPRGGVRELPLTSSLEDIHYTFGVTWRITRPQDSLFTYREGTSFSSFNSTHFVPTFSPTFANAGLEAQAMAMCGEDMFCLFDVAATGSAEIGLSTLQGSIEFETIVNSFLPVYCSPPCDRGACVADDVCSCSLGFNGSRCTEPIFTECDVNPCENEGSCRIRAGSYICSCPSGFTGTQCQIKSSSRSTTVILVAYIVGITVPILAAGFVIGLVFPYCCTTKRRTSSSVKKDGGELEKDVPMNTCTI